MKPPEELGEFCFLPGPARTKLWESNAGSATMLCAAPAGVASQPTPLRAGRAGGMCTGWECLGDGAPWSGPCNWTASGINSRKPRTAVTFSCVLSTLGLLWFWFVRPIKTSTSTRAPTAESAGPKGRADGTITVNPAEVGKRSEPPGTAAQGPVCGRPEHQALGSRVAGKAAASGQPSLALWGCHTVRLAVGAVSCAWPLCSPRPGHARGDFSLSLSFPLLLAWP